MKTVKSIETDSYSIYLHYTGEFYFISSSTEDNPEPEMSEDISDLTVALLTFDVVHNKIANKNNVTSKEIVYH